MRSIIYFIFLTFAMLVLDGALADVMAQYRVHGTVFDQSTGEHLVAATVYDTTGQKGTVSNEYGFYSLEAGEGKMVLNCSYVGYRSRDVYLELNSDTALDLYLEPSMEIGEVTISARSANQEFLSSQMSAHSIHHLETHKMPMLFGEADLIKSLQYLPGVSAGTEGSSGIFVRGGGSDQNLILLDGVPVYNVSHLFGLFSVFNGDAINSATIYKGGFPARFNGRLSSVLDIRLKEGNMQEFHGSASIGILASKLMLEGPIKRDKTSFLVSGRRTYADILSYPVQYIINRSNGNGDSYYGYFFHDFNAKINHKFSDKSRLYLSTYMGKDEFYMKDTYTGIGQDGYSSKYRSGFNWGNRTYSLRWNRIWSSRIFSNLTLAYGTFKHNQFETDQNQYPNWDSNESGLELEDSYYSRVRDLSLRLDMNIKPFKKHDLRAGLFGNIFSFEPGTSINEYYFPELNQVYRDQFGADTVRALKIGAYLEDDFSMGERLRVNLGMNVSMFRVEGRDYFSPEPRASARFLITDRWVAKVSYAHMSQNVHLLTNAMVGLPTDSWVPSTATLPPEKSRQVAMGASYKHRPGIRFSLEGFFKEMENLVEFADGAELRMNDKNWESRILRGSGTAYGMELYAVKESGRWTGSLAYTLSKITRTFPDINFGEPFPYKYDRRHDLSLTANWQVKDHISLGAIWVLASGINLTTQDHSYYNPMDLMNMDPGEDELSDGNNYNNDIIRNFGERNGYKLPVYHRLDLGVNFEKQKERVLRTWSFGAYNIYNRKNPFYVYNSAGWFNGSDIKEKRVFQVTMLPILPYLRYSIRF